MDKTYFRKLSETDTTVTYESYLPNDTIGDQAFEWDFDGSKRKEWKEYLEELERKGTRGDLVYTRWEIQKDKNFDSVTPQPNEYPLESYKFLILDVSDKNV